MIIGIAGPYSAETAEERKANLDRLNEAGARVLEMGHIPLIGINAALPVIEKSRIDTRYDAIMNISLAVIDKCDALLLIKESPGANRERDLVLSKGLRVFYTIEEIAQSNI